MTASDRFVTIQSDFTSEGVGCSGDLYLPAGVHRPPVVMMAHGFGAERAFGLPPFAERFAQRGLAAYLFDYRGFGDSEGEPRNYVDPRRHLVDWQAAVAHVRTLHEVDGSRLALWGTSFSSGHVLVTAARDPKIMAVVAQVPYVDPLGLWCWSDPGYVARGLAHGLWDLLRAAAGLPPHTVKIAGRPGEFAVLNTPETWPGFQTILPEGADWDNRCPARIVVTTLLYRPASSVAGIRCPALIMAAEHDSIVSLRSVERAANRIPQASTIVLPLGHFDIYTGKAFEAAVEMQADFLERHLHAANAH
jgi:pimeloyl-ACP methyl ester carboxylesterase